MPYEVYKADPARYDTMPFRRCGRSGLMLPVISFGLWQNFGTVNNYDNCRQMLLRAFDLPEDKIVWDVGHQSYVYKLLTGRRDKFSTLRKYGGLAGFPKTCESEFDCFNTGHSSTSISAALGIAKANILKGSDAHTVAVIGDGALSGGMATEALCDAGNLKKNFIVVLNDNNMSISKSVGGFTKHLTKLRSVPAYFTFKSRIERELSRFSWGDKIALFLKKFKDLVKHILVGNTVFDDMGFTYFGPVDGHDVEMLTLILNRAKLVRGPVLLRQTPHHLFADCGKRPVRFGRTRQ